MNTSEVPKEVLELAMDVIHSKVNDFPADEWVQIGHHHDLNLFIQEDEFRYQVASLYRIVDGVTDTQDFVQIWKQHIVDDEYVQFQKEQNIQMEAAWLASRENAAQASFADRALDEVDKDLDELTNWDGSDYGDLYGEPSIPSDPYGVYVQEYDGEFRQIGSICNCEDYPCCGH